MAELFRAFSDTSRVRIISALAEWELSVRTPAAALGISKSAVWNQMRGLRQLRLVRARKDGHQVFYCLDDDPIAAVFKQGPDHVWHG